MFVSLLTGFSELDGSIEGPGIGGSVDEGMPARRCMSSKSALANTRGIDEAGGRLLTAS